MSNGPDVVRVVSDLSYVSRQSSHDRRWRKAIEKGDFDSDCPAKSSEKGCFAAASGKAVSLCLTVSPSQVKDFAADGFVARANPKLAHYRSDGLFEAVRRPTAASDVED